MTKKRRRTSSSSKSALERSTRTSYDLNLVLPEKLRGVALSGLLSCYSRLEALTGRRYVLAMSTIVKGGVKGVPPVSPEVKKMMSREEPCDSASRFGSVRVRKLVDCKASASPLTVLARLTLLPASTQDLDGAGDVKGYDVVAVLPRGYMLAEQAIRQGVDLIVLEYGKDGIGWR